MMIAFGLLALLGLLLPLIHLPRASEAPAEAVPERLARLMAQEQPKPPPPPPPLPLPKPTEQPPKPVDRVAEAKRKALQSGLLKLKDELADLRQVDQMCIRDRSGCGRRIRAHGL